ncbi:MAG: DUF3572 family protein [Bauldia sp.]|nr:DUF3572 family protein [Bauldia sp.]MCW5717193.1 DUF3572 family protein [Bauldia sp.]
MAARWNCGSRIVVSGQEKIVSNDDAETIAVQGLAFLANDPDRLGRFLALTGLQPEGIRAAAADPAFLAGVLRHIAGWEPDLLAFADAAAVAPADIRAAAVKLGAFEG